MKWEVNIWGCGLGAYRFVGFVYLAICKWQIELSTLAVFRSIITFICENEGKLRMSCEGIS